MNNSMSELIKILKKLIEEDISTPGKKEDYIKKFEKNYNIEKLNQNSIKLTKKESCEV